MKKNLSKITKILLLLGIMAMVQTKGYAQAFITRWITTTGTISIPTAGGGYNYNITWTNLTNAGVGDGSITARTGSHTITGLQNGSTYQIAITGAFPRINFGFGFSERSKIRTIEQWGSIAWTSMKDAFNGCDNLTYNAIDNPDLSIVTDMSGMFSNTSVFNGNINSWNVSNVTNMSGMFTSAFVFNQPLNNWNTGNVTDMSGMFINAFAFNGNISTWDVSKVTNMASMFEKAKSFNQDISAWNVGNVTNMFNMFGQADVFNQPLNSWNISKVTTTKQMFFLAPAFNQPLNNWNTSAVTNTSAMFNGATVFNQPLNNWNVANVTDMSGMFSSANAFNQPLNNWNTSNVTDMSFMFANAFNFNSDITTWNTNKVTTLLSTFQGAIEFNQNINNWDTGNVTTMASTFWKAEKFNQPLNNWNTSKVTTMHGMFAFATIFNQPLNNWNVGVVTTLREMFVSAEAFNQNLNNWNTVSVTNMGSTFWFAKSFNGDVTTWNTSNVTTMGFMFSGATPFNQNLVNWDTGKVTDMTNLFAGTAFNYNINNWNISNVTSIGSIFNNAKFFNQPLNNWNTSNVTFMRWAFWGATAFNQPLNNWDVSKVANMEAVFWDATSFNQSLASWDMGNVTNAGFMLNNSGLSVANYDATLIGWAAQTLKPNIGLGSQGLRYCAVAARNTLLAAPKNWTIAGDALSPTCVPICNSIYVNASTGNDANDGLSNATAKQTLQAAFTTVADGCTIVLNAGTYNENATLTGKSISLLGVGNPTVRRMNMNGAGKTMTLTGAIQLSELLNLQDGNVISNGNLTLLSTSAGQAYVANSLTTAVIGDVKVQRFVPSYAARTTTQGYNYFSSPVSGKTIAEFNDNVPLVLNSSYDFVNTYSGAFPNFYKYNENNVASSPSASNIFEKGWASPSSIAENLEVGRGYILNLNSGVTLDFVGNLNNGNITTNITRGNASNSGWNLVGNPYPSALDFNALYALNSPQIDGYNYRRIATGLYSGTWAYYVQGLPTGTNGSTSDVALGQGFFVRKTNIGIANLQFNNAMRTTTNSQFFRTEDAVNQDIKGLLKLKISGQTGKKLADETLVYFHKQATENKDKAYDAPKAQWNTGGSPNIYTRINQQNYAINALPSLEKECAIPLCFTVGEKGTYMIETIEMGSFIGYPNLVLEDKQTAILHNIATKPYIFETTTTNDTSRFILRFVPDFAALEKDKIMKNELLVFPNPAEEMLTISFENAIKSEILVRITDLTGREILRQNTNKTTDKVSLQLNVTNLSQGMYIVEVAGAEYLETKKFVKQ
jgi:surface protein